MSCSKTQCSDTLVRLEPATPRSQVQHSTLSHCVPLIILMLPYPGGRGGGLNIGQSFGLYPFLVYANREVTGALVISIKILCTGSKVFAFFGISSGSSLFAKILVNGFQCAEAL